MNSLSSANSRNFIHLLVKTISWTLTMISGMTAVFEPPERGASSTVLLPRLNSLLEKSFDEFLSQFSVPKRKNEM